MFKQLVSKETLSHSLPMTVLVCVTIFFLVGCTSNYTLQGQTTNGTPGSTSTGGSTPTVVSAPTPTAGSTGPGSAGFQVTSVDLTVDPAHLGAIHCGDQVTFTYTATFHLTPNGPGGTISFSYYTDPMAGPTNGTQTVTAGQTTATIQFSKAGQVGPTYTFPRYAGVIVSSPNSINSNQEKPDQQCIS